MKSFFHHLKPKIMDTLSWLLENGLSHISSAFTNFFLYGFLASMAGLALSIFLIKAGNTMHLFERSNGLWTFIAKLNYLVLPLSFSLFFGFTGGVWGVHSAAENYIDESTAPLIDHATAFLPDFQDFVKTNPQAYASMDDAVKAYKIHLKRKSIKESSYSNMNVWIAEAAVESFGGRSEVVAPVVALAQINPQNIQRKDLTILPMGLKAVCSFWMFPIYWAVFIPFFNVMLFVLGELFLYRLFFQKSSNEFQLSGAFAG